jgi:acetyl-CoA synthetase
MEGVAEGVLVISRAWPGQARTIYGDHQRFIDTYFKNYPGYYFAGDGARRDEDGYYWITGRVDDVINVSGHRMGTAEIESALVMHEQVAEAAVVGYPHDIKGQGIYAYVTLNVGVEPSEELRKELVDLVRKETLFNGRPVCQKPVQVKSCAAFCVKWPLMNLTTWAIPPHLPIHR